MYVLLASGMKDKASRPKAAKEIRILRHFCSNVTPNLTRLLANELLLQKPSLFSVSTTGLPVRFILHDANANGRLRH